MGDYAEFDALIHAQLDALARRPDPGTSFGAAHDPNEARLDELRQLIALAGEGDRGPSFGEASEASDDGPLRRARREFERFARSAMDGVSHAAVVETGATRPRIRTRVQWGGDTVTHAVAGASPEDVATHLRTLERSLSTSTRRLRLLASIVSAAGRIAVIVANPIAAAFALPIAYRWVIDAFERWIAERPSPSGAINR